MLDTLETELTRKKIKLVRSLMYRLCVTVFALPRWLLDTRWLWRLLVQIRIDGSTPSAVRQDLVDEFQDDKEGVRVALLSIRACGTPHVQLCTERWPR